MREVPSLATRRALIERGDVQLSFQIPNKDAKELAENKRVRVVGIKVTLDKIPGASWRTRALIEKKLPFLLENFGGWLNTPCYYFFWSYIKGALFNASNYDDPTVKRLIEETLHMETSDPGYRPRILQLIEKSFEDLPRIPLWQPTLESAMSPKLDGYTFWYHRQMDARSLKV